MKGHWSSSGGGGGGGGLEKRAREGLGWVGSGWGQWHGRGCRCGDDADAALEDGDGLVVEGAHTAQDSLTTSEGGK